MAEYFYKDGEDYKKVDDTLLPQSEVDKVVESRLERQKKQFADYETLKEKAAKVDTINKDWETKLGEKDTAIGELQGKLKSAALETEKVKVIHEFKLSDELSEFVTGDTADELRERAEKLSKGIGVSGGKVVIKKDGKPGEKTTDSKTIAKSLFGAKE
jgi:hypothetical protein